MHQLSREAKPTERNEAALYILCVRILLIRKTVMIVMEVGTMVFVGTVSFSIVRIRTIFRRGGWCCLYEFRAIVSIIARNQDSGRLLPINSPKRMWDLIIIVIDLDVLGSRSPCLIAYWSLEYTTHHDHI